MGEVVTQMETGSTPEAGGKLCLLTLDSLDGRCSAVKRIRAFEVQVETDLGGGSPTAGQKSIMRRAAVLSALLEDTEARWALGQPMALNDYCAATNVLRRLLATLGIERRPKLSNDSVLLGDI